MIGHAPLYGLTQREQLIVSFIAGFHHGISRKTLRAYRYANMVTAEDWAMVRKLSTFLAGSRRSLQRGGLRNEPADQAIQKRIRHLPAPRLEVSL